MAASDLSVLAVGPRRTACGQEWGDAMAMDRHDTLMGSVLVISGGLTFAYTRAASKILLILTLIGAAATIVIGVLLFFHLA